MLMQGFEAIQMQHIAQSNNKEADSLANDQLKTLEVVAVKLQEPRFQGQDEMQDITQFLMMGECPEHLSKEQKRWLVRKATRYQLIEDKLYHKGRDLVLRRVPFSQDIESILRSCHDDFCGGHFAQEITSRKILQVGFVWSSLHKDVQHWYKICKSCQTTGVRKLTYELQTPITSFGPFEKWEIDDVGSLPRTKSSKEYILVGVDYMTRWAEATSTNRNTARDVEKFIFDHICSRFGTPLEIIFDRGPGFCADLVNDLMARLNIKHRHSTPYYPQCNGLVERINGVLCMIIAK